jgi:chromosome segregation ATPase
MESFDLLEQAIYRFTEKSSNSIGQLTDRIKQLEEENFQLKSQVEKLEHAVLAESKQVKYLSEERQTTKDALDALLASVVELESQQ